MESQKIYNISLASAIVVLFLVFGLGLWLTTTDIHQTLKKQSSLLTNQTKDLQDLKNQLIEIQSIQQNKDELTAMPELSELAQHHTKLNSFLNKLKQNNPLFSIDKVKKIESTNFKQLKESGKTPELSEIKKEDKTWLWSPDQYRAINTTINKENFNGTHVRLFNIFDDYKINERATFMGNALWLSNTSFIIVSQENGVEENQSIPKYSLFIDYYDLSNYTITTYRTAIQTKPFILCYPQPANLETCRELDY